MLLPDIPVDRRGAHELRANSFQHGTRGGGGKSDKGDHRAGQVCARALKEFLAHNFLPMASAKCFPARVVKAAGEGTLSRRKPLFRNHQVENPIHNTTLLKFSFPFHLEHELRGLRFRHPSASMLVLFTAPPICQSFGRLVTRFVEEKARQKMSPRLTSKRSSPPPLHYSLCFTVSTLTYS